MIYRHKLQDNFCRLNLKSILNFVRCQTINYFLLSFISISFLYTVLYCLSSLYHGRIGEEYPNNV